MIQYIPDAKYHAVIYDQDGLNYKEFERCTFTDCNFSVCAFKAVTFIDCIFNHCDFNSTRINHVAFRTVYFNDCSIKDVNFAMCDPFIFEIHFDNCTLDFLKFYTLKIKGTTFKDCSLVAVDFMSTDLTAVDFDNCDLYRSEFNKAVANNTNFKTSFNYTIDPRKTKLKKALFSLKEVKGLLLHHHIIVEQ